jgi:hypothetical protein
MVATPVRSRWNSAPMIPPARATPERERVVRALVGVGPARALTRAPRVDDARVVRADVVDLDAQLPTTLGSLLMRNTSEVAASRWRMSSPSSVVRSSALALLAAVGVLEQRVHVGRDVDGARGRQPPHRVAALDVFDLDHLCAPVGEEGGRRRHEGVLGDLEDPDTVHH